MLIPPPRRTSHASAQESSWSRSFVEGLAASHKRAVKYEAVDTRTRHASSESRSRKSENLPSRSEHRRRDSQSDAYPRVVDDNSEEVTVLMPDADETSALLPKSSPRVFVSEGKSTLAQTVFNITNLLVGIGLLSLPLGIHEAGWILGIFLVVFGAIITAYTAVLLARVLETEPSAFAYSDLAKMSYGRYMTWVTAVIFMLELSGAGSGLTILFGDSLHAVLPGLSSSNFKLICFLAMLPGTLLPLRILSYTSILGILSTVTLVLVIFFDGLSKLEAPGSLRNPMPTDTFPSTWKTVPLSIGLLVSSFGGHGILPQVYRDMQDRRQFTKAVSIAYLFATLLCVFVGVISYLMFGRSIQAEVTLNLLSTPGYSHVLNGIAVILTGITSLTKIPLATKSIAANVDVFLGLKTMREEKSKGSRRLACYLGVRFGVNLAIFLIAVLVPSFDRVMSVLGSAFVFLISIILPTLFYVRTMYKTKRRTLTKSNTLALWALIIISSIIATIATIWAFVPQR